MVRRAAPTPPCCRRPGGSVSSRDRQTTTVSRRPITARTWKTPRQSVIRRIWPPMSGATIGAAPETSMRVEKKRAISTPSYRSRTTARAMTMPAAPARPWSSRNPMRSSAVGAKAQTAVARTYTTMPASSGRRRPHLSLMGPTTSWPRAMPARQAVRVSWTVAAGACSAPVTSGRAGRYMSMESGGRAVRPPRTSTRSSPARRAAGAAGTAPVMCPSVALCPLSGIACSLSFETLPMLSARPAWSRPPGYAGVRPGRPASVT